MLEAIRHAMEDIHKRYRETMDLPKTAGSAAASSNMDPHEVDPALRPVEKELKDAVSCLRKLAAEKDKPVHASDLRSARETLGACGCVDVSKGMAWIDCNNTFRRIPTRPRGLALPRGQDRRPRRPGRAGGASK